MYKNELQVKEALGIENWRNLSKDKVVKFAAMMPNMDKEVMFKIIEQFPQFKEFAKEVLNNMQETFKGTLESNEKSQEKLSESFAVIKSIIEDQINEENISFEEKKYYMEKLFELLEKECEKDTENKKWLSEIASNGLIAAGGTLLAAIVFVGGKVLLENNNS